MPAMSKSNAVRRTRLMCVGSHMQPKPGGWQSRERHFGRSLGSKSFSVPDLAKQYLERFRNYCGLIKVARSGFPWEKTTKGDVASVYTNCETALNSVGPGCFSCVPPFRSNQHQPVTWLRPAKVTRCNLLRLPRFRRTHSPAGLGHLRFCPLVASAALGIAVVC
jgi:hypothetical protein